MKPVLVEEKLLEYVQVHSGLGGCTQWWYEETNSASVCEGASDEELNMSFTSRWDSAA